MRRPTRVVSLFAAGLACAAFAPGWAQPVPTQAPTFSSGVGLVQVPVVVRDADDRPVHGLPAEAFDVFEAGRQMTLISVEEVRRDTTEASYVPREVLVVVDDLNIRPEVMPRAVDAARQLLTRLDPRDRVAFLNTSTQPDLQVDFTTGRASLERALSRARGQQLPGLAFGFWQSRRALGVLKSVLDQMRREAVGHRRPSLVLFTEGYGIPAAEQSGLVDQDLLLDVREIVGLAAQANVTIHAIDAAGLDITRGPFRSTGTRAIGPASRRGSFGVSSSLAAVNDLSALAALAHDTGGRLTRWNNDLLANLPEMLADADTYYLLTYEMPEFTDRDRRGRLPVVRQLDVRIRRPDLEVRARQGYVHPRALS